MEKPGDIKITKTKDKENRYWRVTKQSFIKWKIIKREQIDRKEYLKK
ncbi:MAG: hypothetical protein LBL60_03395 [Mycoplasmataceae bacterium]|jgi:hypothetical protein|nr:hypothetical protein [Mycoplasmataceae bacterium]MDR0985965.1 hypothetical protein [Mycoplasmataceae bacterium]